MGTALELWTLTTASPRTIAKHAAHAEAAGYAGIAVVDSQNLSGDPYVALAMAATQTERIGLATAVTNPVTRHPAATAAGIASVHLLSNGRATLGIGRGDSSLAHLGRAPAGVKLLEHYIDVLQAYLRREPVPFEALGFHEAIAPDVATLGLADTPEASRMTWLPSSLAKVAVEVAATGPRVIAAAARAADRIMFALGADVERIAWGIETARAARREAGLDESGIRFGAYINLVCHPHVDTARQLVSGGLTTFARFQVMHGSVAGPKTEDQQRVLSALHSAYDMKHHTRIGSPQAKTLTDEFIDGYAIVGAAPACVDRLRELAALGLERIVLIGPTAGADPDEARNAGRALVEGVLPEFAA